MINRLPLGVQMYTLRDDYARDAEGTLKKIKAMGYDGIELYGGEENNLPTEKLNELLAKTGLKVFGYQPNWAFVQEDTVERTFEFCRSMGITRIGVASAPIEMLPHRDTLEKVIAHLNKMNELARKAKFQLGYHTHKTDFVVVDGKTAWDRIFENTPKDFTMVLDTGNAMVGNADSISLLKKFPGRSPWVHLKPFKPDVLGATMVGEDAFNWPELLETCVKLGKTDTMLVEYSNYARYQPMEAAALCCKKIRELMK
jgi:sugar phosphate isomerase/epimerase